MSKKQEVLHPKNYGLNQARKMGYSFVRKEMSGSLLIFHLKYSGLISI